MKFMRKITALLLVVVLCLSMTAFVFAAEPTSGTVGDSKVTWAFQPSTGLMLIGGSGDASVFQSKNDQPWAVFRDQIKEVWFDDMSALAISDLAYWFTDCTSLTKTEIPYTTLEIGADAFAGCENLKSILFYYQDSDAFSITPGAFHTTGTVSTGIYLIASQTKAAQAIYDYDWDADNRTVYLNDVYTSSPLAWCYEGGGAHHAGGSLIWDENGYWDTCEYCGTRLGYHSNDSGGSDGGDSCSHSSTTKTFAQYSSSQHSYKETCNSCGETMSSGYASHSLSSGAWTSYSASQHRRTSSCSLCGYSTYEYGNHSLSYGSWTTYSETQHRRTVRCATCSYSSYGYGNHADSNNDGKCDSCGYAMSAKLTWDTGTGESTTTQQTYNAKLVLPVEPTKDGYTFLGWYTAAEDGTKVDETTTFTTASSTTYYAHWELIPVFSVTVPANLPLVVDENGDVHTGSVSISNNSTADVKVSAVTVQTKNSWTLVPYAINMAKEQVDTQLIGFTINGSQTIQTGSSEALTLKTPWKIAKGGSLPLSYDAIVSATSQPITDADILSVVFVLEWV